MAEKTLDDRIKEAELARQEAETAKLKSEDEKLKEETALVSKSRFVWRQIRTADRWSASLAWYVDFDNGDCSFNPVDLDFVFVRAVR